MEPVGARRRPEEGGCHEARGNGGSTEDTLDPAYAPDTAIGLVWLAVRNCLMEMKENGELAGELAESWEPSADAKTWTIRLRKGVQFHSGKSLVADDVAASINYHRGTGSKSYAVGITRQIADVRVFDNRTLAFVLNAGNADFPWILSSWSLQVLPSASGKVDWMSGDGTGGYILKEFRPGISARLERFAGYWKGDERAHFDEVVVLNIANSYARETAILTKEVDAISRPELKTLDQLAAKGGIRVVEAASSQYSSIPMDVRVPPFDNNDIRLALKYAIDRERLLKVILHGHGLAGNDNPIGPSYRYYTPDIERISYDPEKAKFHLKKAGLSWLKVQLKTALGAWPAGAVDSAVMFSEQAKRANIQIEVSRQPDDGYWSNVWLKAPFCMSYIGGRPTADWIFQQYFAGNSEYNESHWKNEQFDKLLLEARTELDDSKRREMYRQLQAVVRDNGGTMVPLFTNQVAAISDRIATNDKISGNWEMDNWRAVERWWAA